MISDIDKDVSTSKLVSFADDTRLYSGVGYVTDCDNLQLDLNAVYDWASSSNMFFNSKKFSYVCFSSNVSAYKSNLYFDPAMNIIGLSTHVLDLGVSMSSSCTFDFHISNLYKRCPNLAGWIIRTFAMRNPQVMLTHETQLKYDLSGLSINVGESIITQSSKVRDLGVTFDQFLNFDDHITAICRSTHFHIRNIGKIRNLLSYDACSTIIHALISCRLDLL